MLEAPAKKAAIGSLGVAAAVGAVKHHGIVRVHDACVLLWGVDWVLFLKGSASCACPASCRNYIASH